MPQILIIENPPEAHLLVEKTFSNLNVTVCSQLEEAARCTKNKKFDMVLINLDLFGKRAYEFLSELQGERSPFIVCISKSQNITDKVTAFGLGADEYLVHPVDPVELRARIDCKIKKIFKKNNLRWTYEDIEVYPSSHQVLVKINDVKKEIFLTSLEFKLIFHFIKKPDQVFSREQLLSIAWGDEVKVADRAVDVHISVLRKKLDPLGYYLKAVPGIGYKFDAQQTKKKLLNIQN